MLWLQVCIYVFFDLICIAILHLVVNLLMIIHLINIDQELIFIVQTIYFSNVLIDDLCALLFQLGSHFITVSERETTIILVEHILLVALLLKHVVLKFLICLI